MAFEQRSLDDYVDVATRIADFREKYPDGSLQMHEPWRQMQVQGIDKNGDVVQQTFICYTAAAYRTPDDPRPGIGVAWEIFPGRTPYTRGSELQNAETSAWGRAIVAVGASDSKRGIASREEVRNRQAEHDALVAEVQGSGPQGTERLNATPADDLWYDNAAPPPIGESTEDQPGTVIKSQLNRMHAHFHRLGIDDREERLRVTRETLGMDMLGSSSRLSYRQAAALLAALEQLTREEVSGA